MLDWNTTSEGCMFLPQLCDGKIQYNHYTVKEMYNIYKGKHTIVMLCFAYFQCLQLSFTGIEHAVISSRSERETKKVPTERKLAAVL